MKPNPAFELVEATASPTGIPRHAYETPIFKVRDGADVRWDTWPRIDDAIESYADVPCASRRGRRPRGRALPDRAAVPVERAERAQGRLRRGLRGRRAGASRTWSRRELERLTSEIPPAELAIQWDVCYEVQDIEGVVAWMGGGDAAWERFTGPGRPTGAAVPERGAHGLPLLLRHVPGVADVRGARHGPDGAHGEPRGRGLGPRGRLGASRRAPLPAQRGQALLRAAARSGHPRHARLPGHRSPAGRRSPA